MSTLLENILNGFHPIVEMMDFETPIKLKHRNSDGFKYMFTIKDKQFEIMFTKEMTLPTFVPQDAVDYSEDSINYFMGFWDMRGGDVITGKGDAVLVFSTVYKAILKFVEDSHNNFDILFFGSHWEEETRVACYDRMVPRLARKMGWQMETYDNEEWGRMYMLFNVKE